MAAMSSRSLRESDWSGLSTGAAIMHRAPMVSTSALAAQRVERFSESYFKRFASFGMRAVKGSQSKLQTPTPENLQAPSSKLEARAAVWSLELGISLVFGAWFLVFRLNPHFSPGSATWEGLWR